MAQSFLRSRITLAALGAAIALASSGCGRETLDATAARQEASSRSSQEPDLGAATAAKERHADRLLAISGVAGAAVGLTADGRAAVKIFTEREGVAGLPKTLDGVPVVVEVTGEFLALRDPPPSLSSSAGGTNNRIAFPRPVPIGVSTGNRYSCSAGTIAARVKSGSTVYALSNNHVYALENSAQLGDEVLQPGLYDTHCVFDANNVIGMLSAFEPIVFSDTANNTIDAAIAQSSTENLGNATPAAGYGTPSSTTAAALIGQPVQKYGRTTSLTTGTVDAINATVIVSYGSGVARFVDQIIVQSNKPFIKPGDSGSLLVDRTTPNPHPVGLIFAGSSSGKVAIANEIDSVLARFTVTVDGAP